MQWLAKDYTVETTWISLIDWPHKTSITYSEEHARLDFADFLSTLLAIFHVINEKIPPARLLIYLVNKQAEWHFFPSLLVHSGLFFY